MGANGRFVRVQIFNSAKAWQSCYLDFLFQRFSCFLKLCFLGWVSHHVLHLRKGVQLCQNLQLRDVTYITHHILKLTASM